MCQDIFRMIGEIFAFQKSSYIVEATVFGMYILPYIHIAVIMVAHSDYEYCVVKLNIAQLSAAVVSNN